MGVVVACLVVWAAVTAGRGEAPERAREIVGASSVPTESVPSASEQLHAQAQLKARPEVDRTVFEASLHEGAVRTQEGGERGSLNGALTTDYPMVFAPSKYRYLPQSPLIEFTDDMIWPSGEGGFMVKRDAVEAQARHIQEASIALNVSPRVEYEQTTGYRLVEIPENTLFSKMGMVSGDVIVSINGRVPDMEPMALMFVNMVAGKRGMSTIVVDHRGVERTIELRAAE